MSEITLQSLLQSARCVHVFHCHYRTVLRMLGTTLSLHHRAAHSLLIVHCHLSQYSDGLRVGNAQLYKCRCHCANELKAI
jgi:hypothetical protein